MLEVELEVYIVFLIPIVEYKSGDYVRLMSLKSPLSLSGVAVPIQNTELTTTLSVGINATATSLVVTDPDLDFYLNGGFLMIEKVLTSSDTSDALKIGTYQNEIIQYTGYNNGTKTLSGLTRGTNAVFRGSTPAKYWSQVATQLEQKLLVQE